jgi:hypothetical protein
LKSNFKRKGGVLEQGGVALYALLKIHTPDQKNDELKQKKRKTEQGKKQPKTHPFGIV